MSHPWFSPRSEDPDPEATFATDKKQGSWTPSETEMAEATAEANLSDLIMVLRRIRDDRAPARETCVEAIRQIWNEDV